MLRLWYLIVLILWINNLQTPIAASPMFDYITTVLKEDLPTKASRKEKAAAVFELEQNSGQLYPQINLRGQSGFAASPESSNNNNNLGLFLNQVIFDKSKSTYLSLSESLLAEKELAIRIKQEQTILEAGLIFINYVEALKRERISVEHALRSLDQRKFVKDQLTGGGATQIDLQNVEIAIKSLELNQLNYKAARRLAALALLQRSRNKAQIPEFQSLPQFNFPLVLMPPDQAKKYLEKKPDISLIIARIKSLDAQIRFSEAKKFPILGFEASLETSGVEASDNVASLKLSASWNLYDGGTQRAENAGLIEQKKSLALTYRHLFETYYGRYRETLNRYEASLASFKLSRELKGHYKEFLVQKSIQYRGGLVTIENILGAQSNLFDIEQQLLGAEIAMTKATWELMGHLGLLQAIGLKALFIPPTE
ncbi:MAG: TolC family protein [Oligoflexales bacterium]